jgi:hypothetical protein
MKDWPKADSGLLPDGEPTLPTEDCRSDVNKDSAPAAAVTGNMTHYAPLQRRIGPAQVAPAEPWQESRQSPPGPDKSAWLLSLSIVSRRTQTLGEDAKQAIFALGRRKLPGGREGSFCLCYCRCALVVMPLNGQTDRVRVYRLLD